MSERSPIRVLLVDDQPIVCTGIRAVVASEPDLRVVGESASAARGLRLASELDPDVVVLPILIEGEFKGLELGTELKLLTNPPKVLIYSFYNSPEETASSFLLGADSFVHRTSAPGRLVEAIKATAHGRRVWLTAATPPELVNSLQGSCAEFRLTQREQEVLGLVLQHRTNAQIASKLIIEVSTVKSHVRKILDKLGVHGRQGLFDDCWTMTDIHQKYAAHRQKAG